MHPITRAITHIVDATLALFCTPGTIRWDEEHPGR